ncbi:hypothetical protein [Flammeovirga aprica]|uniref:Uncharacterized protein n=1 Tax=Flammeovirga aprica JL-4 TaxID=694437 RepID=A0A7X9RWY6_9BACT|nr:hypothetical protein [Flammeovirga aprica]NME70219.1 hypothetical protein [Flammeovirga aprica JL-4]
MKLQLHFLLISLVIVMMSGTSYGQIQVFGEKGIVEEPKAWGGKMEELTSFNGKEEVLFIQRNTSPYGGFIFDMDLKLDFSTSNVITFSAYNPKPAKKLEAYTILAGVRKKGEDGQLQVLKKIPVKSFDQWEEYSIEINPVEGVDYKSVIIILQPDSHNKEANGMTMYVTDVKAPAVVADEILTYLSTDESGKVIQMDILSSGDLKNKLKKTAFKVIKNGYKELSIRKLETYDRQVILNMDKPIHPNDDIRLSFDKDRLEDTDGKVLKPFKHKLVKNNVPIDFELYSDLNFTHKHVLDNFHGYRSSFQKGVTVPGNVEDMAMKVELKEDYWGALMFNMKNELDITKEKVFKVKVFVPQPPEEVENIKVELCLRVNQKLKKQLKKKVFITTFNEWVEVSFDFKDEEPQTRNFNSICLAFDPSSSTKKGTKLYIKDFMGPRKRNL